MGAPPVPLDRPRARRRGRMALRAVALVAASAVMSTLMVGVITAPGLPRPGKAGAQTQNPRLCSGVSTSGTFNVNYEEKRYDLYVPQGAVVTIDGSFDKPHTWDTDWYVDPFGFWLLGGTHAEFSRTWTNNGPSGYILVRPRLGGVGDLPLQWRFTAKVLGVGGSCLDPTNTLGQQCAGPHLDKAQGHYVDPVNAATGNLHEDLIDFSIPARGPGLALSHSYNSLQAPTANGPLGYGWTHSYAESLAVGAAGVVTVTQESGATLPFYPLSAGGFTTPPWAVATLVQNTGGSYTMTRCNALTF